MSTTTTITNDTQRTLASILAEHLRGMGEGTSHLYKHYDAIAETLENGTVAVFLAQEVTFHTPSSATLSLVLVPAAIGPTAPAEKAPAEKAPAAPLVLTPPKPSRAVTRSRHERQIRTLLADGVGRTAIAIVRGTDVPQSTLRALLKDMPDVYSPSSRVWMLRPAEKAPEPPLTAAAVEEMEF